MEGCSESGIGEEGVGNMRGKSRGEIRGEAGEVSGVVANAPTANGLGERYSTLVDGGWQLEKWRYCWWLVGLMWMEVQKSDFRTSVLSFARGLYLIFI